MNLIIVSFVYIASVLFLLLLLLLLYGTASDWAVHRTVYYCTMINTKS